MPPDHWKLFTGYASTMFFIATPYIAAPIFVGMTASFTAKERMKAVNIASITAFITMVFFALTGQKIFEFIGVEMGPFRIGGGIFICAVGLSLLMSQGGIGGDSAGSDGSAENSQSGKKKSNLSIALTPIGIPLLCGPGSITTITAKQSELAEQVGATGLGIGLAAIAVCSVLCYLFLFFSAKIAKYLNSDVLTLLGKLTGLILLPMGLQMVLSGLRHPTVAILPVLVQ